LKDLRQRRKKELVELTVLTGTNINNWQDEATAKNDEETNVQAQYATLLPQVKDGSDSHREENKETMPAGIILFAVAMLGGAGLMRWKGII
jgi:hypothetical protein